jgi:molybdate ABC transporter permease protein
VIAVFAIAVGFDISPLWISAKTSVVATVITVFLGLLAARWMSRYRGRGRELIDGVFALPMVLPPTVVGFFLLLLLGRNSPLGRFLDVFGITIAFSWAATVIAAVVVSFPMMYRTTLGALAQVNTNVVQAARTLGASEWRIFRDVILPLAKPGIIAGTVLAFARALGEFGGTLMLAGNIPGRTQTAPIAIFFAAEGGETGQAMVWVIIIVAVALFSITTLNFWSKYQRLPMAKVVPRKAEAERTPISFSIPERQVFVPHDQSNDGHKLEVDVERVLPAFALKAKFTASEWPMGLLGSSGSGKSMLLRCLAGIDQPTRGRIVLNDRVLFDSHAGINVPISQRRIGMVFQDYALFPHRTVAENVAYGLQDTPPEERAERIQDQLKLMQLGDLSNRYPSQLSGGQRQRVALARALVIKPIALFLDEPFSALDAFLRRQLENQLSAALSVYEGVVMFVTHDMDEAYRFCKENLMVLAGGRVLAFGDKRRLFERPSSPPIAQLTGCKNLSRIEILGNRHIRAVDWGCDLNTCQDVRESAAYVGIRSHHIEFPDGNTKEENTFAFSPVHSTEGAHEVTLYMNLGESAESEYQLEADLAKDQWQRLRESHTPWHLCLPQERLFLMEV